jgi:hypothetical protein
VTSFPNKAVVGLLTVIMSRFLTASCHDLFWRRLDAGSPHVHLKI